MNDNQDSLQVACNKIKVLIDMKRYADAVALIKAELAQEPNSTRLYNLWAKCELSLHHLDEGERLLRKSLSINPDLFYVKLALANVVSYTQGQDAAIGILKGLLTVNAEEELVYSSLSLAYEHKDCYTVALDYIEKAIRLNPENYKNYLSKARLLRLESRLDEAAEMMKIALQISPNEKYNLQEMGWIALANNDFREAKKWFEQSLAEDPTNSESKEGLRCTLKMQNEVYEAFSKIVCKLKGIKYQEDKFLFKSPIGSVFLLILTFFVYTIFCVFVNPASNLVLIGNSYGRNVLRKGEFQDAVVSVILWVLALVYMVYSLYVKSMVLPAFGILLLTYPSRLLFSRLGQKDFKAYFVLTLVVVALAAYICVAPLAGMTINYVLAAVFLLASIVLAWLDI